MSAAPTVSFAQNDNPFATNDGSMVSSITDLTASIQTHDSHDEMRESFNQEPQQHETTTTTTTTTMTFSSPAPVMEKVTTTTEQQQQPRVEVAAASLETQKPAATETDGQILKRVLNKHTSSTASIAKSIVEHAQKHDNDLKRIEEENKMREQQKKEQIQKRQEQQQHKNSEYAGIWGRLFGYGAVVSALGVLGLMVAKRFRWV